MTNEIEIEKKVVTPKVPAEASTPAEPSGKIVTWQFKKRQYQEITGIVDKLHNKTRSGNPVNVVIKARNWRLDLDLTNPIQKEMHEHLMRRKNINEEYYLLSDKSKTDKVSVEATTLKKLMEMSIPQLMGCITIDELQEVGIMSGNADKYQLITAIMRKKKLA